MNKIVTAVVLSLFVGTGLAWAHEGHDAEHGTGGKEVSLKGELVDMACYMAHEGKGKKHADCARMCVLKDGAPLGLVTPDGKTYLLVEDHMSPKARKPFAQAKELVSETVTIKGDAYERGGLQAVVVESVTKE